MVRKKKKVRCIAAVLVIGALLCERYMPVQAKTVPENYEQGEILVLYEEGVQISEIIEDVPDEVERTKVLAESGDEAIALVQFQEDVAVDEAVKEYEKKDGVLAVTPNYILELNETEVPDDPGITDQQYLSKVCAEEAWEYYGQMIHEKVRVAVLDTGADIHHPDLQNIINLEVSGEVLDKNGTMGPLQGDDYINGTYSSSGTGHGTHVCGILAAEANNQQGIAGVGSCLDNSAIELMVIDIFSNVKTTNMAYLIYGMEYAAEQGAKVINLSLGVDKNRIDDTVLKAECDRLKENNITLVCAAGNDGTSDKGQVQEVPCDYDSTVGVAAVDAENQRASFSNYGTKKDIAAPGVNIYSTLKTSSYGKKSGTSMAAPIVSAAAGMIYALRPDITTAEVKEILKKTADRIPDEDMQEIGVLNCESALKATGGKVWLPFKDVAVNSWYYDHVAYIYKQEIMTGLTDTIFGPEDGLVRAQFAMILYRLVGEPEALYMWTFPDVGENEWYTDAVAWAGECGVITGYTNNGCFGPNDLINREQLAVMLYRYTKIQESDMGPVDYSEMERFEDSASVSDFAKDAVAWAVNAGIIQGDNGRINPQGNASRAECATMTERFLKVIGR